MSSEPTTPSSVGSESFPHRYSAALAGRIEALWQDRWDLVDAYRALNPGEAGFDETRPKKFVLDMFPYPSGVGLHVGHPLGYIATDIYARYLRMTGHNVVHAMGFDSFGLPAEQYAVQTGTHPRITTEKNIATMRVQLRRLGLGHERRRSVSTTDPEFYRWTQWIFLQIYHAWYDVEAGRARPIRELEAMFASGEKTPRGKKLWSVMSAMERASELDAHRLAYVDEVPVNWCPMLGTVLANEEVTSEGRSERGNYPVYRRPLKQWIMRITAYAERLLKDLEPLDWPEPIKLMQRNWIGRSEGAEVEFGVEGLAQPQKIRVFTTRPDTLFGATYVVLSPEHALVDAIVPAAWPEGVTIPAPWKGTFSGAPQGGFTSPKNAVAAYRAYASKKSDEQRTGDDAEKTGVFTGVYAINPATGLRVPIFIADYVLAGYGTGAIMAVPAHDDRDFEFARALRLPIRDVVYSRLIAAMRYFALHAYPTGEAAPHWREQLADFMGITTSNASNDEAWDVMLPIVLNRRSSAGAMRGVELDAPGSIGERRGAVRSVWVETIDSLGLRGFDDLLARFEEARFWEARGEAHTEPGVAANSAGPSLSIDGMTTDAAKHVVGEWLRGEGVGRPTVTFKLRDWLFSRQRYWGEPFPIVYDEWGRAHALPEKMLPVLLPDLENFRPESSEDPNAPPRPPLARASAWTTVELDLGDGKRTYTRETNTMPNWAGSCWYYLRYLDPTNQHALVGKDIEAYWMGGASGKIGGVDLYVGGVEHAVLHLLYARFWHKVLFDLGHVSTAEPFQTLFNQGYIQAFAFKDAREMYVDAFEVRLPDGALAMEQQDKPGPYTYNGEPVTREYGKMGKSLKNAVAPDEICAQYGCDTMRIYEMAMGPLEASKPWNTRDIAGSFRFLQRVWRNLIDEQTGLSRVTQEAPTRATLRVLHKTIIGVRRDMEKLGFNTVVSKLIELNNHLSELPAVPLEAAKALILMLAPHAPHAAEELWHRVVRGGTPDEREARATIVHEPYPVADQSLARDDEVEIPVSVLGKLRSKVVVPAGSSAAVIEAAARADAKIADLIAGKEIKKVIVVPGKMVNFVI